MSEEREPIRLREDPAEDAGLRAMLNAARGETADDAMLERVLAGVLAGGGGGGSSGGGGGAGVGAKIAAAIGASVIGAGAIALLVTATRVPPVPPVPPASVVVAEDAALALDAGAGDTGPGDTGLADAPAHVTRVRVPPPPVLPPTTTAPAETDQAMLLRATRERDPSASLAIARDHAAQFPQSPLAEDREALIVVDLARLNRAAEARAAADAFRARWPRSPDLPRIDAALARMTAP